MNDTIRHQKSLIRKTVLARRNALSAAERMSKSNRIKETLFGLPQFQNAGLILFYVAFGSEVQTEAMIREAGAAGKIIAVPVTDRAHKCLQLCRIDDFDQDLAPGTWGILEPKPECRRQVAGHEIDMIITPGIAFSLHGWRIGYGGGYYDRLLREHKKPAIALAFELQIVENDLPHNPEKDVPVNFIVTEERVISCSPSLNIMERWI